MWIAVIVGGVGLVTTAANALGSVGARYVTKAVYEHHREIDSLQHLREFAKIDSKLDTLKMCIKYPRDCR